MTANDLILEAERLERTLAGAPREARLEMQPKVSMLIDDLRAQGAKIPSKLRRLDAMLCDEAIEARFDNMPI
ncbi:hypothetical protein ACFORG_07350 [Lutimaribacter marinistellae]|uniref:Uncharacterized protein n=1 Tax=Lutimaribacter marinistellae TaxID=1820329 RepID=A0ABV7TDC1_9RHOB